MNLLIQFKTTPPLLITPALFCQGFCRKRKHHPISGYPNFTTAAGTSALTSHHWPGNTAAGWFSLWGNAAGSHHRTGAGTLLSTPQTKTGRLAVAL
jgi:hypothetical protein